MFSLTYSSAYDPYHTVFRFMALTTQMDENVTVHFEAFRILDFYHCFPWELANFKAYTKVKDFQRQKNAIIRTHPKSRFDVLPDRHIVFQRMLASQLSARLLLEKNGNLIISRNELQIQRLKTPGETLEKMLEQYCKENNDILYFLGQSLSRVPLYGSGGLKDRSNLGEFRYDVA